MLGGACLYLISPTWLRSSPHLLLINSAVFKEQPHIQSPPDHYTSIVYTTARNNTFATVSCLPGTSLLPSVFRHPLTVSLCLRNQSSPLSRPLSGSPPPPDSHSHLPASLLPSHFHIFSINLLSNCLHSTLVPICFRVPLRTVTAIYNTSPRGGLFFFTKKENDLIR